jgi:LPS-assembly lipoprotein
LFKKALIAALVLSVAGCGFRLRGTADVPFETLHIPESRTGIGLDLRRNVEAGTRTRVVDDSKSAQAILQVTHESRGKQILTLTGTGAVREYQLRYQVSFRVHDGKGGEYVPQSTILLTRDMTYADALILAKEAEEQLLFRDMQTEAVHQIVRRLAGAQPPKPPVQ